MLLQVTVVLQAQLWQRGDDVDEEDVEDVDLSVDVGVGVTDIIFYIL